MKLNTQGRYALIALVDLSSRSNSKNISLSSISARQNISLPYLEQLFLKLRKAGIVKSFRGSSGGYVIAKSPDLIRITEILKAVDQLQRGEVPAEQVEKGEVQVGVHVAKLRQSDQRSVHPSEGVNAVQLDRVDVVALHLV